MNYLVIVFQHERGNIGVFRRRRCLFFIAYEKQTLQNKYFIIVLLLGETG